MGINYWQNVSSLQVLYNYAADSAKEKSSVFFSAETGSRRHLLGKAEISFGLPQGHSGKNFQQGPIINLIDLLGLEVTLYVIQVGLASDKKGQ